MLWKDRSLCLEFSIALPTTTFASDYPIRAYHYGKSLKPYAYGILPNELCPF